MRTGLQQLQATNLKSYEHEKKSKTQPQNNRKIYLHKLLVINKKNKYFCAFKTKLKKNTC